MFTIDTFNLGSPLGEKSGLAHEDATEYRDLLSALVEEHQPAGATEAHLALLPPGLREPARSHR
jgi:hypothetical protein